MFKPCSHPTTGIHLPGYISTPPLLASVAAYCATTQQRVADANTAHFLSLLPEPDDDGESEGESEEVVEPLAGEGSWYLFIDRQGGWLLPEPDDEGESEGESEEEVEPLAGEGLVLLTQLACCVGAGHHTH
jgi:hypothetical protein